jgi:hypothetical protein
MPFPPAHPATRNNVANFNTSIKKTNCNQPAIVSHRANARGNVPPKNITSRQSPTTKLRKNLHINLGHAHPLAKKEKKFFGALFLFTDERILQARDAALAAGPLFCILPLFGSGG